MCQPFAASALHERPVPEGRAPQAPDFFLELIQELAPARFVVPSHARKRIEGSSMAGAGARRLILIPAKKVRASRRLLRLKLACSGFVAAEQFNNKRVALLERTRPIDPSGDRRRPKFLRICKVTVTFAASGLRNR